MPTHNAIKIDGPYHANGIIPSQFNFSDTSSLSIRCLIFELKRKDVHVPLHGTCDASHSSNEG
jgi:hypothetical protein